MATTARLDRPVSLRFMGDWGAINLTRICGWLAQEVWDRSPGDTRSLIYTGRGNTDNLRAVAQGEVDVAVVTPSTFANMAIEGIGLFEGEAYPYLRALGEVPMWIACCSRYEATSVSPRWRRCGTDAYRFVWRSPPTTG